MDIYIWSVRLAFELASYITPDFYTLRLSLWNTSSANRCLTKSPNKPHRTCAPNISAANLSSLRGPNHTNHKFNSVKFVLLTITPSSFVSTLTNRTLCSKCKTPATNGFGGTGHGVMDGSSRFVWALYRGSRCLGHGIRWKSCGTL